MKTNTNSFKKLAGACGVVSAAALAMAFYGCSSSPATTTTTTTTDDGGTDATTPVGGDDGGTSTPVHDSGTTTPTPDAGDAGAALILQKVAETKVVADTPDAGAAKVDPNLLNAWGLAFNPTGTAWVSDNHSGLATLYSNAGGGTLVPLVVQIPLPDGGGGAIFPAADSGVDPSAPTGQIYNASATVPDAGTTADFLGDVFIISAEDGTISGWAATLTDKTKATLRVDMSSAGASFKGLQIIPSTPPVLLAADFHNAKIDAFDTNYAPLTIASGKWTDPSLPTGYAPYNIYATATNVFMAFAKQDAQAGDDQEGNGFGAISVFDLTGTLVKSLVKVAPDNGLDGPWGMTLVPAGGWGSLPAGALLVGNFEGGAIHAFDATSGVLLGTLVTSAGTPVTIPGLWALTWGPNTPQAADGGTLPTQLFFTAGPNMEADGLYGYLTAQ
jgi:uncharacterized protein (TIGR03118 family)